jgi:hypothetical protein
MASQIESAANKTGSARIKMPLITSPLDTDTIKAAVGFMVFFFVF